MLALRALLIRASNSAVDYHTYLNQLAALSRRDIAFSVTAQKQKVIALYEAIIISISFRGVLCGKSGVLLYQRSSLIETYFITITTRAASLTEGAQSIMLTQVFFNPNDTKEICERCLNPFDVFYLFDLLYRTGIPPMSTCAGVKP